MSNLAQGPAPIPEQPLPGAPTAARALIPWLPEGMSLQLLASGGPVDLDQLRSKIQTWRDRVEERGSAAPTPIMAAIPPEAAEHVDAFMGAPVSEPFRNEGWRPALVDLRTVAAAQPFVFVSDAGRRLASTACSDLRAVAECALPLGGEAQISVAGGANGLPALKAQCANPNLRILAPFAQLVDGNMVLGFAVGVQPSVMQVVRFRDRLVLRDGYHRATEMLRLGVNEVPVLLRDIDHIDELFVPAQRTQLIPDSEWLGRYPPLLPDYQDESVSVLLQIPAASRAIVVQGSELPWP